MSSSAGFFKSELRDFILILYKHVFSFLPKFQLYLPEFNFLLQNSYPIQQVLFPNSLNGRTFDQVLTTAKVHIFVYKHIIVEKKKKISNKRNS